MTGLLAIYNLYLFGLASVGLTLALLGSLVFRRQWLTPFWFLVVCCLLIRSIIRTLADMLPLFPACRFLSLSSPQEFEPVLCSLLRRHRAKYRLHVNHRRRHSSNSLYGSSHCRWHNGRAPISRDLASLSHRFADWNRLRRLTSVVGKRIVGTAPLLHQLSSSGHHRHRLSVLSFPCRACER